MTEHKKKNRTREQVATQLISDPELGKVLMLATPPPESLEEDTTPEPRRTTPMDAEELMAKLHADPATHTTTALSSMELDAVLSSSASRSETLSLHRLPKDFEESKDDTDQKQGTRHTQKWTQERFAHLVDPAKEHTHQTEQLSSAALGDLLAGEEHTVRVPEHIVKEVETVRWDRESSAARLVSAHEAAALLEVSSMREDGDALHDVPETQCTEKVSQEELDTIMELATKTRPRQGKRAHEILGARAQDASPPKIALLEEKMPPIRKAPTGHYQSMIGDTPSRGEQLQTLLLTLLVIVGLGMVGALLFHMWPR